jgi:hypothetical protein
MSVFKPFVTSDVVVSPFEVNKTFTFSGDTALYNAGIDRYLGKNITSSLWISGSNQTGNINQQDQYLLYRSIQELYYSNYLNGINGSPLSTASFNTDGTITGESYTPSYYNYLGSTLPAERYFPQDVNDEIVIISIPSNMFGEYIEPNTFTLTGMNGSIHDDGNGNIMYGINKMGDIIYEHGIIILTQDTPTTSGDYGVGIYGTSSYGSPTTPLITDYLLDNVTCSFQSHITLYETQYKCTIRQNEFTFSQNPSLISGSSNSGIVSDFATGSYFNPYITTVGLYNNNKELLAVAKLSQPLPVSSITDTNIIINLDMF